MTTRWRLTLLAACSMAAACSTGGSGGMATTPTAAPLNVPARFVPQDAAKLVAPADTLAGDGCLSPLKDPAKGTQLILIRSESGIGDYLAPSGSYGIPDGRLLRIDCNTGTVLGLVRR